MYVIIVLALVRTLTLSTSIHCFSILCLPSAGGEVALYFLLPQKAGGTLELYRSTTAGKRLPPDPLRIPVARFSPSPSEWPFIDRKAAHNTFYYYRACYRPLPGFPVWSSLASCTTSGTALPPLRKPSLFVDKENFILEVRDDGAPMKRYPIDLGQNSRRRKLFQDRASTPEGIYKIICVQNNATYYKAYDLDYPTPIDRIRYRFALAHRLLPAEGGALPPIGGEIQIHGLCVGYNWTWGCIAMRNRDMDELMSRREIGVGTEVLICGSEVTEEDMALEMKGLSMKETKALQQELAGMGFYHGGIDGILDEETSFSLGSFQLSRKLPVTCEPDSRTLRLLRIRK
ncbi:MAG: L,D-transpeptidase family protein [Candidatus Eremiobacteraeota bacterium]|nr:L,D-transpeptidase family protein [Candidatus Eremiobacteraeota bacterium]